MPVSTRSSNIIRLLGILLLLVSCTPAGYVKPPSSTPTSEPSKAPVRAWRSESIGKPNNGSLRGGVMFEPRPGYRLNNPNRSYGTEETVLLLDQVMDAMLKKYPDTCDLFVGDISTIAGGRLYPHISHQSGRDVDVGLYAKGNRYVTFINFNEQNLDVEKTWYYMETLLMTDRVQLILLDWKLQRLFYEYLKPIYSKRKLESYIQYPRQPGDRKGIIRHAPGHGNHLHIRFKCPESDGNCKVW